MSLRSISLITLLGAAVIAGCAPSAVPAAPTSGPPPAEPTQASTAAAPAEATPTEGTSSQGASTYVFLPGETVARFVIDEVLAGNANTVVGITDGVTGEITLDLASPQQASLSTIQVDLAGLETDSGFRNRAIREAILKTDQEPNRYATFVPTRIEGLPAEVTPGTVYTLQITGDLTIKGTTTEVTFEATVTAVSDDRIEATASLTRPYADFDVEIPFLPPQVASVEDNVTLEIELAAVR